MLVGHDAVKPDLVGQRVLLVVLVVKHVGFLGVEERVGKSQPPGVVLFKIRVGDVGIGLLGKPENLDGVFHSGSAP